MSSDHSHYFSSTTGNQSQQQPLLGTNAVTQALSSLQAKVAHLEQERDHYALECERITALHKEEMMKMEKTIRTEREEAARRQDDLRESISRAAEERARLVAIIDEKKIEHSQAMHKLERIREAEAADNNNNNTAKQSPYGGVDDLTLRVSQCKRQQDNTQSQIQNLLNQIEVARREREVCEATNDRVMAVLRELGDHVPPPLPPPTYTITKRSTSTTTTTRSNNGRRSASPRGVVVPGTG
eukprot:PhF_6_TR5618/c2_g1_i2/m.8149